MSRSGYSDDYDTTDNVWRGAVASALHGKRGQAFLREMLAAFDAMPTKRLIDEILEQDGEVCAIGAVGVARKMDMQHFGPENDPDKVGIAFGIASAMAAEIAYQNDEAAFYTETPEQRFTRMRAWVVSKIR